MSIKLQKYIAQSGYCSRRKAESLIASGDVKVNGKTATVGLRVNSSDKITVSGKLLTNSDEKVYIALNKPLGYVCSNKVLPDEKSVFSLVDLPQRLFVVGRLDKESHGLVILTNDGDFSYRTTHPSFCCEKEYLVSTDNNITVTDKELLVEGFDIGEKAKVKIESIEKVKNNTYRLLLKEGKNRQIRRSLGALGYTVTDLKRLRIGNYKLEDLKKGCWKFVKKEDWLC